MNVWWMLAAWLVFFVGILLPKRERGDGFMNGFITGILVMLCFLKAIP